MASARKWTVLAWLAGDNNLEPNAFTDIKEMKRVGSNDDIDIVVQLDTMHDNKTRRYHLSKGTDLAKDLVEELGETNTGDPQVAIDFLTWGMAKYPAERTLAVLWNHGGGIDEADVFRRATARGVPVLARRSPNADGGLVPSRARTIVSSRHRHALFHTMIDAALERRIIAIDDTSRDFLDNAELRKVLEQVTSKAGRKIDLLGFDACLMNMVEIAYELHPFADYIVGSEETEPGEGWPYDRILTDLVQNPKMSARELGGAVVKRYLGSYGDRDEVTQSLLDLSKVEAVASAVDAWARALGKAIADGSEYAAFTKGLLAAQSYAVHDFVDLFDLCRQVGERVRSAAVRKAGVAVENAVGHQGNGLVAAEGHKGASLAESRGVSIYFPRGGVTVAYDRLGFAQATHWAQFFRQYQGPKKAPAPRASRRAAVARPQ